MFNRKNTGTNTTTRSTSRPKTTTKATKGFRAIDTVALRRAGRVIDKAGTGLFRWMVTDHTNNIASLLVDKPISGFWAAMWYQLKVLLLTIGIVIARVLLLTILYIIWIPIMIWLLIYVLTH